VGEGVGVYLLYWGLWVLEIVCFATPKKKFAMDFDATVECTPDRKKDYGKVILARIIFP